MSKFTEAIARMEGFYIPDARPARNHNPGDLEYRPWQTRFGAVLETLPSGSTHSPRFAAFPDDASGFEALSHLFTFPIYRGKTVTQAINTFAPPTENDTRRYVDTVCSLAGCTPTDIVDTLL